MAKYVMTKDDSIGGKILEDGKVLIAKKVNGTKIVEIVEMVDDVIDQAAPMVTKIIRALQDFFNDIFHRFPPVIRIDNIDYVFTIQPAPYDAIDRMFYESTIDANEKIFKHEHKTRGGCRKALRDELKEFGYM